MEERLETTDEYDAVSTDVEHLYISLDGLRDGGVRDVTDVLRGESRSIRVLWKWRCRRRERSLAHQKGSCSCARRTPVTKMLKFGIQTV
jgi:hypothetical protein